MIEEWLNLKPLMSFAALRSAIRLVPLRMNDLAAPAEQA